MRRLTQIGLLFCCFTSITIGYAQKSNQFAIGLMPSINNSLISYAIVTQSGGTYLGTQQISQQQFMFFALGYWPTRANPQKENLFLKNGIKGVELTYDDYDKVNGFTLGPLFDLWRIKYQNHPMSRKMPAGWSHGSYNPSRAQAIYLHEKYGVINVNTHYFVGENLFLLLKDMQDPAWVQTYQSLQ
ncbi:MAG: hypothetical protein AB8B74_13795 [Crocinitomicaceae bacterium]